MKKTTKILGLAVMAALLFSCEKTVITGDNTLAPVGPADQTEITPAADGNLLTSFGAVIEGATKVSVDLASGTTAIENDDEVLVFVDKDNHAIYTYNGTEFVLKDGETAVSLSGTASVFYPAGEYEVSGSSVLFVMPAGIEANGDFGAINPMAGVINGEPGAYTVELGNLASVLRVKVNADVNIESMSLDYGSMVYFADGGKFIVNASDKTMSYNETATSKTEVKVTLKSPAETADVLFLIPTVQLPSGLSVTAKLAENHNGGTKSFTITNPSKAARSRNTISTMSFYAGLFSGGEGTQENPYKIATARDLKNLQKYTVEGYGSIKAASFLGANYQQQNDIQTKNANLIPIGTESAKFTGVYDGNGTSILNVAINTTTDNTGIFGYIENATIKDLTVTGTVSSSGLYTAGIAGQMSGTSLISGCTNTAMITNTNGNNSYTAGIVGRALNTSKIISCVNEGYVNASKAFAAGIVGDMTGTIDKCINKGEIDGGANTGGIAGSLRAGSTIRRCYSSKGKTITGTNRVGGIVGYQVAGTVANCFSNSNVTVTSNTADYGAGGLVGILGGLLFNSATGDITVKCSASCTDKTKAVVNVGGLVGRQTGGTIQNVYSPLYAKDIKIGSIHGRSGSGKIGQIVGVVASGNLCAYYFGGCAEATIGWQYWGTNEDSTNANRDGQWAFTSAKDVSMDWTAPVAKDFSGFGQSLASGEYHLKDVLNIDKSSSTKYSKYTPTEGEVITWSDLSSSDFHAIPDALMTLGADYYSN
ncbi:MAG: hypothetical protein J6O51_09885 [Bacteroidales bacterium]|nr:hypothetical protein [Bacteroidales bacterium]